MNNKKRKKKKLKILRYRTPTFKTIAKIVRFWKKYALALFDVMTRDVTVENPELNKAKYKDTDVQELTKLIRQAEKDINIKFVTQTNRIIDKEIKGDKTRKIATVDLASIKKNPLVYKAFVEKMDEHIFYFKKFPDYVYSKIEEHLEKAKETVTFDGKKLANTLALTQAMSRRHANFIARDQIGKFTASINEAQSKSIGVKKYIWRTVGDNRVRHEHAERNGKTYYYSNPPADGNPGMPVRCRCFAETIIPDFE